MALLLLPADGVQVASIPVEAYRIVVSPSIPTSPLFTLTGYLLAEGGATQRIVRFLRALRLVGVLLITYAPDLTLGAGASASLNG